MVMDFIYFDVGGVVILDFSKTNKWDELLENIGVKGKDKGELNRIFTEEEYRFCAGEKDADTFIEILTNRFNLDLPENYSFLDDFVNRFESNPLLAEIIRDLKQKYQIGLLTNMYPNMLDGIKSKGLLPNVYWDVVAKTGLNGWITETNGVPDAHTHFLVGIWTNNKEWGFKSLRIRRKNWETD